MLRFILLFFTILSSLFGATAFNLDGVKSWDILIINKDKTLKPYIKEIKEQMIEATNELSVKLQKSSPNTLLFKIQEIALGKNSGYIISLNLGEFLKRESINKDVFAFTYEDVKVVKKDDVQDLLTDTTQAMLDKFVSDYKKDNNHKDRVKDIKHSNFAKKMNYIQDYNKAISMGLKEKKYVMVVADAVSCPWCRKLEENILSVKKIDKILKSKYITATIDVDKKGEPKELKKLKSTPIIYIVDPRDKKVKAKFIGYPNCVNFIEAEVNKAK